MPALPPRQPGKLVSLSPSSARRTIRARNLRLVPDRKSTHRTTRHSNTRKSGRLPGSQAAPAVSQAPPSTPFQGTADPRWVLAVRTAEMLEGTVLSPERRERIVRMAKLFGLTAFDANMIIAIVQDQARRGIAPHLCPAAGEAQLRMISPPAQTSLWKVLRSRYGTRVLSIMGVILFIEVCLLWWAF